MLKTNYRLREYFLAFMCLTILLFNGCTLTMPKLSKSSSTAIEKNKEKDKTDKHSVIMDESTTDNTVAKQDTPHINASKPENRLSVILEKEHLSNKPLIDVEKVVGEEELGVLKKVKKLEAKLRKEREEREKTDILVKELNKKISALQAAETAAAAKPGAGYLADGSTIGLGIVDGDDELRVLKKVKRLEARLEEDKSKLELLNKDLIALKASKEIAEKELADSKILLQKNSKGLLEKIKVLESTVKVTEERAIAAENELHPIQKELLKVQISETKAQQELYKLKIEKLKRDEE
jgi:hypothetical protein